MGGGTDAIKFILSAQDGFADLNQARSEHDRVNLHQANEVAEVILQRPRLSNPPYIGYSDFT